MRHAHRLFGEGLPGVFSVDNGDVRLPREALLRGGSVEALTNAPGPGDRDRDRDGDRDDRDGDGDGGADGEVDAVEVDGANNIDMRALNDGRIMPRAEPPPAERLRRLLLLPAISAQVGRATSVRVELIAAGQGVYSWRFFGQASDAQQFVVDNLKVSSPCVFPFLSFELRRAEAARAQ